MHQTQYLTFNTRQRHAGQILVSGDDCNAIGLAHQMVLLTAIPII